MAKIIITSDEGVEIATFAEHGGFSWQGDYGLSDFNFDKAGDRSMFMIKLVEAVKAARSLDRDVITPFNPGEPNAKDRDKTTVEG